MQFRLHTVVVSCMVSISFLVLVQWIFMQGVKILLLCMYNVRHLSCLRKFPQTHPKPFSNCCQTVFFLKKINIRQSVMSTRNWRQDSWNLFLHRALLVLIGECLCKVIEGVAFTQRRGALSQSPVLANGGFLISKIAAGLCVGWALYKKEIFWHWATAWRKLWGENWHLSVFECPISTSSLLESRFCYK